MGTIDHGLAFFHVFSLKDVDMAPFRYEQFMIFCVTVGNHQALFTLVSLPKLTVPVSSASIPGSLGFLASNKSATPGQATRDITGFQDS